jgi:tRNA (uracil-5-)-methyltransferase TRM9
VDVAAVQGARRTWEAIAESFDATRRAPWPPVLEFLQSLQAGARVLDAGTGNGRHAIAAGAMGLRPVGMDLSRGLLRRARGLGGHRVQGLLERPPFARAAFAAVLCAAAMHHVRPRAARVAVWAELRRVTAADGALLATVWAREAPLFARSPPTPWPAGEPGDAQLRWRQHGLNEPRFVHLYEAGELANEVEAAGWRVTRAWSAAIASGEADNHLVVARPER